MKKHSVLSLLVFLVLAMVSGCHRHVPDPNGWVPETPPGIHQQEGEGVTEGENQTEGEAITEGEAVEGEGEIIIVPTEGEASTEGEGEATEGEPLLEGEGETLEGEGEGEIMSATEAWTRLADSPIVVLMFLDSDIGLDFSQFGDNDGNGLPEYGQFALLQGVLGNPDAPHHSEVEAIFRQNFAVAQAIVAAMRNGVTVDDFSASSFAATIAILGNGSTISDATFDWDAFAAVMAAMATIAEPEDVKAIDLMLNDLHPSYELPSWAIDLAEAYGISVGAFNTSLSGTLSARGILSASGDIDGDGVINVDEYRYADGNTGTFVERALDQTANQGVDPEDYPRIVLDHVGAYNSVDYDVSGHVEGLAVPENYGVVFPVSGAPIAGLGEDFNARPVPATGYDDMLNLFAVVTPLSETGGFTQRVFGDHPTDAWALQLYAIVVPLSAQLDITMHFLGLVPEVEGMVAWTSYIRDWRSATIPEFYSLDVNMIRRTMVDGEVQVVPWANPWSWIDNPNMYGSSHYPAGSTASFSVGRDLYLPHFMYWEVTGLTDFVQTPDLSVLMDGDKSVTVFFADPELVPIYDPEGEGETATEGEATEGEVIVEGEGETLAEGELPTEGEVIGEGEAPTEGEVIPDEDTLPLAAGKMTVGLIIEDVGSVKMMAKANTGFVPTSAFYGLPTAISSLGIEAYYLDFAYGPDDSWQDRQVATFSSLPFTTVIGIFDSMIFRFQVVANSAAVWEGNYGIANKLHVVAKLRGVGDWVAIDQVDDGNGNLAFQVDTSAW